MASILGCPWASPRCPPAYVAAKHAAVVGLTKNAGIEEAKQNIRANAIGPASSTDPAASKNLTPDALNYIKGLHPIGRLGTSDEVAALALFLLSNEALHHRLLTIW